MRMFLYYAFHSFINQIKKLFKTWVMVFIIVCFVFGMGIGILAVTISDLAEKNKEETEITETVDAPDEDAAEPEEEKPHIIRDGIGYDNFLELVAAGIVIVLFALSIVNADKNAGKLFLPADVNLLFPSPLKPQSVMLFRIGMQIGTMIIMGLYLLFQLPNLVFNVGLSVWAGVGLIAAFSMTMFLSTLMQLLTYLLASKYDAVKRFLRPGLVAVLVLIAGGFFTYQRTSGQDYLTAASAFFNAKGTQYVPFWGWMKGFVRACADGNLTGVILFLAGFIGEMVSRNAPGRNNYQIKETL